MTEGKTKNGRIEWMDAVRGLAVLLVVLLHVPVLPMQLGAEPPPWLERWQFALQPYRMPTLLFLSGMLLESSLTKGTKRYISGKLKGIVWPYLVWTFVTVVAFRETEALLDPRTWIIGYHHLWFLMVLTACYALGLLANSLPVWVFPAPLALIAIGAYTFVPDLAVAKLVIHYAWWSSFFFLGATSRHWMTRWQSTRGLVPGVLAGFVLLWSVFVVVDPEARWSRGIHAYALSVGGVLLLIWCASRISWPRWMQWVGKNSIVWYLVHGAAIGGCWLFLEDLGVTSWWIVTPILLVVGYLVPLALSPFARTPLFRWSRTTPPILTGRNA
ncbi:acyltransferase family protein [Kytococcus schroeteri]|uniref:acyltransferase family protein n=1 Tax=Kytococcus schroeteri TaxID=138300 RepID=UPI0035EC5653